MNAVIHRLEEYAIESKERLITAVNNCESKNTQKQKKKKQIMKQRKKNGKKETL